MRAAGWILGLALAASLAPPLAAKRTRAPQALSAVAAAPAVSPTASPEALRLAKEVALLRWRLREDGREESLRGRPLWWDLPHRRQQQERLEELRELRLQLELKQARLEALQAELSRKTIVKP